MDVSLFGRRRSGVDDPTDRGAYSSHSQATGDMAAMRATLPPDAGPSHPPHGDGPGDDGGDGGD